MTTTKTRSKISSRKLTRRSLGDLRTVPAAARGVGGWTACSPWVLSIELRHPLVEPRKVLGIVLGPGLADPPVGLGRAVWE